MRIFKYLFAFVAATGLSACGGSGGGNPQATATSTLCDDLVGLEAIYWDFINGEPRGDLPSTAFSIPFQVDFSQTPYTNSTSILLGFTSIPQGWTIADGIDVSGFAVPGTVAAADLTRTDNRAVWRYVFNAQVTGGYTSAVILDSEVNTALNFIGNTASVTETCQINLQQNGIIGLESVAAKVLRAGDFTIMARAHVVVPNGLGGTGYYDGYLSLAPTSENAALINDIFIPMITQLYGGGTSPNQCEDGIDNDGDGKTDLADPQCESPADDSEST
ncbi:MAG TPA: hypothetical protein ENJ64_07630 [Thiotrichales bacterium]|nr:hypothetical protein [Thiotrichales bacterium]